MRLLVSLTSWADLGWVDSGRELKYTKPQFTLNPLTAFFIIILRLSFVAGHWESVTLGIFIDFNSNYPKSRNHIIFISHFSANTNDLAFRIYHTVIHRLRIFHYFKMNVTRKRLVKNAFNKSTVFIFWF